MNAPETTTTPDPFAGQLTGKEAAAAKIMNDAMQRCVGIMKAAADEAGITPPIVVSTQVAHATIAGVCSDSTAETVRLLGNTLDAVGRSLQQQAAEIDAMATALAEKFTGRIFGGEAGREH